MNNDKIESLKKDAIEKIGGLTADIMSGMFELRRKIECLDEVVGCLRKEVEFYRSLAETASKDAEAVIGSFDDLERDINNV